VSLTVTLASRVEDSKLYAPDGTLLGTLKKLLLHPSGEPVVVGAMVRPPAALVVLERPDTYIPLSALRFADEAVYAKLEKLPKARASAEALGFDPDLTVIWTKMPVVGPSGTEIGVVGDFGFDPSTGAVLGLVVDGGAVANAAYGKLDVPIRFVTGYEAGAVHISVEATGLEPSGGLAKAAAVAVVGASESVAAVGEAVGGAVVDASGAAGRAIKAVKDSKVAGKVTRKAGKTWSDTVKAFRDGMKDDK
jgi:hypothetical protein